MEDLKLPFGGMVLRGENEEDVGFYIGLWQYIAYFFALLRRVDPFGQQELADVHPFEVGRRLGADDELETSFAQAHELAQRDADFVPEQQRSRLVERPAGHGTQDRSRGRR